MAKKFKAVTYRSDKDTMEVLIDVKSDYPITVKVEDRVWNYKGVDETPRRIKSGDKYFRPMTFGERVYIGRMTVENAVNKRIADGTLMKPKSKADEARVSAFIFTETRKAANDLRGKLVIDTW